MSNQEAQHMLYLDTDAVFSSSKYTPTDMYHQLHVMNLEDRTQQVNI